MCFCARPPWRWSEFGADMGTCIGTMQGRLLIQNSGTFQKLIENLTCPQNFGTARCSVGVLIPKLRNMLHMLKGSGGSGRALYGFQDPSKMSPRIGPHRTGPKSLGQVSIRPVPPHPHTHLPSAFWAQSKKVLAPPVVASFMISCCLNL